LYIKVKFALKSCEATCFHCNQSIYGILTAFEARNLYTHPSLTRVDTRRTAILLACWSRFKTFLRTHWYTGTSWTD